MSHHEAIFLRADRLRGSSSEYSVVVCAGAIGFRADIGVWIPTSWRLSSSRLRRCRLFGERVSEHLELFRLRSRWQSTGPLETPSPGFILRIDGASLRLGGHSGPSSPPSNSPGNRLAGPPFARKLVESLAGTHKLSSNNTDRLVRRLKFLDEQLRLLMDDIVSLQ